MKIQVGCTLTPVGSQLACHVMLGYTIDNKDSFGHHTLWWQKVWGSLPIGQEMGDWGYLGSSSIVLVRSAMENHTAFGKPGNRLVILDKVPFRFAERITPFQGLNGTGRLVQNNVNVNWEMWHHTRPLPR